MQKKNNTTNIRSWGGEEALKGFDVNRRNVCFLKEQLDKSKMEFTATEIGLRSKPAVLWCQTKHYNIGKKDNQTLNVKLIEMSWLQLTGKCPIQNGNEEPVKKKP